ncbi:3D domain-containing protein [Amycolatopsis sp. NPDC005003]
MRFAHVLALTALAGSLFVAPTASAATLPACRHFYSGPIPDRPVTGGHGPGTLVGAVDVSNRLPAPGSVSGGLGSDGKVTFTFARVAGAKAYRAFRNGQALQWISDWGQPTLTVTDASPCENANYQLYAMTAEDNSPGSLGQISTAYRLDGASRLAAYRIPAGTTLDYRVTSYNDVAQTALGYQAGPGFCAVDARTIPWGTRFSVPGYGECYAADIGSWIKDDIVDVWLPGSQADAWGIQRLTLTVR